MTRRWGEILEATSALGGVGRIRRRMEGKHMSEVPPGPSSAGVSPGPSSAGVQVEQEGLGHHLPDGAQ